MVDITQQSLDDLVADNSPVTAGQLGGGHHSAVVGRLGTLVADNSSATAGQFGGGQFGGSSTVAGQLGGKQHSAIAGQFGSGQQLRNCWWQTAAGHSCSQAGQT